MFLYTLLTCVAFANAVKNEENFKGQSATKSGGNFKDQHCTDPRTMRKHAAYSEWADAYSCSRHRCQPGGRNLAIYTVGCKRVEAPESAIECEEVVEDTNMQFPYCCTRLRCLVVVRGEVWTRVLGQPWETLPAAPWSHMYKIKKPPPTDDTFVVPKQAEKGPIYELQTDATEEHEKSMRASKSIVKDTDTKANHVQMGPTPDIVIALTTGNDDKEVQNIKLPKHRTSKIKSTSNPIEVMERELEIDGEEALANDKVREYEVQVSRSSAVLDTLHSKSVSQPEKNYMPNKL